MSDDPFAPISSAPSGPTGAASNKVNWVTVIPVPREAPAALTVHRKLGKPSARWCYTDSPVI